MVYKRYQGIISHNGLCGVKDNVTTVKRGTAPYKYLKGQHGGHEGQHGASKGHHGAVPW